MTPERWRRIKSVYEAVDSATTSDRGSLLDRLCESDVALRKEVEHLLGEPDASTFLRELVDAGAAGVIASRTASPIEPIPGTRVGKYLLEERLGAGGMGVVFRAFDETLQRTVALKFLLGTLTDEPEQKQR